MTLIDKIILAMMVIIVLAIVLTFVVCFVMRFLFSSIEEESDHEVVKVEDINIGHTIYDLFPEWREEFKADPMMDEIAATCDLYLAAKELLKGGTTNVKLIVSLDDAVHKFEKYAL